MRHLRRRKAVRDVAAPERFLALKPEIPRAHPRRVWQHSLKRVDQHPPQTHGIDAAIRILAAVLLIYIFAGSDFCLPSPIGSRLMRIPQSLTWQLQMTEAVIVP